ncbi:Pimeloyl-ACP methyl ester carboxylesterase [Paracoccus isoporae]|uniref:Pimeloyl-ACP methyl ester carboxylesterase n=1 Tax=Paracoccus isoporae TaxID=591205 RepID=A0A1G7GEW5_9RHOB|nr:alpha/beta fold hydrolase [Paracoccus isoporae]SDE86666.1 Pimeloyl-ACP methyl ester carboxylesterase [Paracoccus isoporae]
MTLYARQYPGDPDRPAIGLHCMMGSSALFGPLAEHLDGAVDLYAFDFPGHGRSPAWLPEDGVDLHTFVTRHAARMIERPVDLIGHSFGATVALRIAVGVPEAVRSLTLVEPVLFAAAPTPSREAVQERLAPFEAAGDWDGMLRRFLGDWGAPGEIPTDGPRAERLRMQMAMVLDTNAALMADRAQILREGGLESVDAPVMLISGAESPPIVHEIADALSARLPDVGRATVPGAGHMLPLTHPSQFADLTRMNLERA